MAQTDTNGPAGARATALPRLDWLLPRNWSLRGKLAALVVAASLIPVLVLSWILLQDKERTLVDDMQQLLAARSEQMARELDRTHEAYLNSTIRLARQPSAREACAMDTVTPAMHERLLDVFKTFPASDGRIRGVAMLDRQGRVNVASEPELLGADFSARTTIRRSLSGESLISGIYLSSALTGSQPTVAYLVPVAPASGGPPCVIGLWLRADAFLHRLVADNGQAGPGSYSVIFDDAGVRIGHSLSASTLYRPAAPLPAELVDRLSKEQRFGPRTRERLNDVLSFEGLAENARAPRPAGTLFLGKNELDGQSYYGVGRRLHHAGWTVFYLSPERNLTDRIAKARRECALIMAALVALAATAALAYSANLVRTLRRLGSAAQSLAEDGIHAHVPVRGKDELALLSRQFNSMAMKLRDQSAALRESNEQLERRVRERTGLLNAIIDNSPAVIYAKDLEGRFMLVNNRFCELFGLAREDIVGRTNHAIFDKETADAFRAMDVRVAESGSTLAEEEHAPSGGRVRTYLSVKCPLRDEQGRIEGVVGVSTDITARTDAEGKLLAQLDRLRLLDEISTAMGRRQDLNSIHAGVIQSLEQRLPVDLCCIYRYERAADALVVETNGAHGPAVSAAFASKLPATIAVGSNGLRRCVSGELVYEGDLGSGSHEVTRMLSAAGMGSAVLAPLQTEDNVFGILIAARRVDHAFSSADCEFLRQLSSHVALAGEQAQLTDALRRAYDDLRQSQQAMLQQERLRALGQMASGIAHDINNAISPAALYAESLLEREAGLSARSRQQLETIARAIDDVAATVARMREFYRNREAQAERTPVDINAVAEQVADLTRARWSDIPQQRGIAIDFRLEPGAGLPPVHGSEHELREALINLVFNAVDAMPEGGRLVVRTRTAPAGAVCVEVQDEGVGMDADTRRRCLEPFFTTKGERGTGLGLAMVYGVAQRHEADIEIDTAPGHGTCVRLVLPAAPAVNSAGRPVDERPPAVRLLLVDDDPTLLASLHDTLLADGHEVVAANGGEAGIAAFVAARTAGAPYDLVITDLGMPGMDGRQVAGALKAIAPGTPIIMLTGWGQPLGDSAEPPPGVDRILAKPPRMRELRAVLAELLSRHPR